MPASDGLDKAARQPEVVMVHRETGAGETIQEGTRELVGDALAAAKRKVDLVDLRDGGFLACASGNHDDLRLVVDVHAEGVVVTDYAPLVASAWDHFEPPEHGCCEKLCGDDGVADVVSLAFVPMRY